jgi:VIT1/CCC1 family predicted Fe2+/Mn2+ transporter
MAADMEAVVEQHARSRLLDPVDRISEIIFGLVMAVTFVGTISVATAGSEDVRTATASALGCNLAWGLVDAVMYVVRRLTERTRRRRLARRIVEAAPETARDMIAKELPPGIADITGPRELEAMRQRLRVAQFGQSSVLTGRDFLEAAGVFLLVVLATFPLVVPFLLIDDIATAKHVSRGVAFVMLFIAGYELGRYAGHPRPLRLGAAMAVFGAILILAVIALGG